MPAQVVSQCGEVIVTLWDGSPALLRPVMPEDRFRIQAGLAELSLASRCFRFFVPVRTLAEDELRYFTEVDQTHHVAWLAVSPLQPDRPGLGIGRFVRYKEQPSAAEVALTVVDAHQGKGVGTHLLAVLFVLARARSIHVLHGVALPDNHRVVDWFLRMGATVKFAEGLYHLDLLTGEQTSAVPRNATRQAFDELVDRLQALLIARGQSRQGCHAGEGPIQSR